jgi:hypothetical protein
MFYKESYNFLNSEDINFIENVVLNNNFPFYQLKHTVSDNYQDSLTHTILKRPEDSINRIVSPYFTQTLNIIKSFFNSINIKGEIKLLRLAINFTYNNGYEKCEIHQDHPYDHTQLIIYLNDPLDKESKTVILDKDHKTILKEITPEKYKGVWFEGLPHTLFFPKKGNRIILIATFENGNYR